MVFYSASVSYPVCRRQPHSLPSRLALAHRLELPSSGSKSLTRNFLRKVGWGKNIISWSGGILCKVTSPTETSAGLRTFVSSIVLLLAKWLPL